MSGRNREKRISLKVQEDVAIRLREVKSSRGLDSVSDTISMLLEHYSPSEVHAKGRKARKGKGEARTESKRETKSMQHMRYKELVHTEAVLTYWCGLSEKPRLWVMKQLRDEVCGPLNRGVHLAWRPLPSLRTFPPHCRAPHVRLTSFRPL